MNDRSDGIPKKLTGWLIISGSVMCVCGILAITLPLTFSVGLAGLLGCLILIAGAAHVVLALHSESLGFVWQVLLAVLYGIAAINLLVNPLLGVVLLTLVLGIFLAAEGVVEIALYLGIRHFRHSGWILVDGIVTFILGIVICSQWPPISLEVIGALVGVSLILSGVSRLMLSLAVRELRPPPA